MKQKSTRQNVRQQHARMTLSVHLHRHDVLHLSLTVLLRCPITIIVLIMKFVYILMSEYISRLTHIGAR